MTARLLPDVEAIVVDYLLGRPEVSALVGTRVGTELDLTGPAALPALRVGVVSVTGIVRRHLDGSNLQIEGWAESRVAARDLCETARAVLLEDGPGSIVGVHPGFGVVTGTEPALGPVPSPDPETDTPRWLASVIVYAHPARE